ncbi:NAD-binding protein [Actinopolymorpha sp. B11F2]|uniref:NAD-binding protein n=1 Tax=Actinopolymorpha sp. B11F2 TaxID=3160862 RepID=UPI0032E36BBD
MLDLQTRTRNGIVGRVRDRGRGRTQEPAAERSDTRKATRTTGHYVVCGSDSTAARITTELLAVNEAVTVIVPDADSDHAQEMAAMGATLVVAARPHEAALREAGVETAQAIALVAPDDLGNVHAALTAEELNKSIRLVVHIVNPRLAEFVENLVACEAMSAADMAAPEFVAAALGESEIQSMTVGGRKVVAGPAELLADPPLTGLARTSDGRTELLPNEHADLVLATGVRRRPRRVHPRLDDFLTDLRRVFDARLRLVALFLVAVIAVGSLLVHFWPRKQNQEIEWPDAIYIAVSTVTLTGFDDPRTSGATTWVKLFAVGVQLFGLVMVSLVTAAIVDAFVGASLARSLGVLRGRPRGHVVVCGLGTVGTRVAELLHDRGFNVVAVEVDPEKPGVRTARALRIPVLIGDVSQDAVLREARLHRCRALLAVTNDDVANLQAGLYARARNADARVVLRLFDHEFAGRVQDRKGMGFTTRSVSTLAAPAFADALLERRVDAVVPAGRRVIVVTEVTIRDGAAVVGDLLGDLVEPQMVRFLAHRTLAGGWNWDPALTTPLRAGDRVAVVTSRAGLARVLLAARPARQPSASSAADQDDSLSSDIHAEA